MPRLVLKSGYGPALTYYLHEFYFIATLNICHVVKCLYAHPRSQGLKTKYAIFDTSRNCSLGTMLGKLNTISFTFNSSQAKEPNRNSNILKIIIIHNGLIGCEYSVHIKNSQYLQEFYSLQH